MTASIEAGVGRASAGDGSRRRRTREPLSLLLGQRRDEPPPREYFALPLQGANFAENTCKLTIL
jgi:hypothetical protein